LTLEQRRSLETRGVHTLAFYAVDYPARRQVDANFPSFGGILRRPYRNTLVPGHDVPV
jgi:hypothetical protein